jgi:competence protein ComEC
LIKSLKEFWRRYPALHIGLSWLLGTACAFGLTWELIIPGMCLFSSYKCILRTIFFSLIAFFYTSWQHPPDHFKEKKMYGVAEFHIQSLKVQPSPFHKSYLYKGTIMQLTSEGVIDHNLPCSIYLPFKKNRPKANCDYRIKGTLVRTGNYHYILKPDKNSLWSPIENTWNLAEWRFKAKEKVKSLLKKEISSNKSASFLTALATGDIDERSLTLEFNKLGIQHILAISGFHFALIAAFLSFFLKRFL